MKKIYLSAILALFILQYNNSQTANDTIAIQDLDEVVVSTPFKETVKKHKKEYLNALEEVLDSGIGMLGPKVSELENKLSEFTGSNPCYMLSKWNICIIIGT